MLHTFFKGFMLSMAMIMAIGAQNAFVLRQGLQGRHVFPVALICALSDLLFIVLGVMAVGALIASKPWLALMLTLGGAVFLLWYGARSFYSASRSNSVLEVHSPKGMAGVWPTVLATLAVTYLNPGVYLDTLLIIGGMGASLVPDRKAVFVMGTGLASILWFFGLAYGARLLQPLFVQPKAWRMLELLIGVIMWSIALPLLAKAYALALSL